MRTKFSVLAGVFFLICVSAHATVDDSLSLAYELASPYVKQGYTLREDPWAGDLGVEERKAVTAQLFKGNDYWFFLASDTAGAELKMNVYYVAEVADGVKLADTESIPGGSTVKTRVTCTKTGMYYIIVKVMASKEERTSWALVYGYK